MPNNFQEGNGFQIPQPEQQRPAFNPETQNATPEMADLSYEKNRTPELQQEKNTPSLEELKTRIKSGSRKQKKTKIPMIRNEVTVQIENIMEEGLDEAFMALPVIKQQQFKMKGEETAFKIQAEMKKKNIQMKKIFRYLLDWLSFLPGINKLYLRQEAKIKADQVVRLKRQKDMENSVINTM